MLLMVHGNICSKQLAIQNLLELSGLNHYSFVQVVICEKLMTIHLKRIVTQHEQTNCTPGD